MVTPRHGATAPKPPGRTASVRISPDATPVLLVVIDTEEEFDWTQPFDRRNVGVGHMQDIERLQGVFDEFAIRPVYTVAYPIATQAESCVPLRAIVRSGRAEIGAHLHPWVTPPFDEEVNARNSYPGNLPRALERAKIARLARAIEEHLGVTPRVYKAGRYGFGEHTAAILEAEQFEVDLSRCPAFDFSADGGPDYTTFGVEPSWFGSRAQMLAIPTTGAFVGVAHRYASALHRWASLPFCTRLRVPGILARSGVLERLMLSPEGFAHEHHRRLTRALYDRGVRTFTFSLHSPSIRPGFTPYVRSEAELVQFLDTCRRYFEFFLHDMRGVSHTALELKHSLEKNSHEVRA